MENPLLLNDTDLLVKINLDWLLAGKHDDKSGKEELHKSIELSFLYNHINVEGETLIFKYGEYTLKFENLMKQYRDLARLIEAQGIKDLIISTITSQDEFKSGFESFLRDRNINKLID